MGTHGRAHLLLFYWGGEHDMTFWDDARSNHLSRKTGDPSGQQTLQSKKDILWCLTLISCLLDKSFMSLYCVSLWSLVRHINKGLLILWRHPQHWIYRAGCHIRIKKIEYGYRMVLYVKVDLLTDFFSKYGFTTFQLHLASACFILSAFEK